jgi:DNA-directed RNA polymerase specialized sigma24 family protein
MGTRSSTTKAERIAALKKAVQTLTEKERQICIWRKVGFSDEEIGSYLGLSAATVARTFSSALKKFRRVARGLNRSPGQEPEQ